MKIGRTDANQKTLTQTLRDLGARVFITSNIGQGFPDVICAVGKHLKLIEFKDGSKPPSKRCLTADEEKFHEIWKGHVVIINSVNEAIEFVNKLKVMK